jgi:hypothetical protein
MPSGKSAYLEAAILDLVLGATAWSPPGTIHFALSTSPWNPDADGSGLDEPVGGAYARVGLTNNTTNFPDATGSNPALKLTGAAIAFPTATGGWGTIYSVYACTAASAGQALYGGDLPVGVPIGSGSLFSVPAGSGIFSEV